MGWLCFSPATRLMCGRSRTRQEASAQSTDRWFAGELFEDRPLMNNHQAQGSPAKPGLTDDELAIHPTVFAADALKDLVVVVSGGAGGIGPQPSAGATTSIPAASSILWWSPRTGSTASRIRSPRDPASSDFRAASPSNGR